ncbi:hypothetical protein JJB09_00015 [Rhizobium sp. KVB221]|uniref:DUF680 domain-containing protein n=1 Tax=Rhizobium setariae TaxID=2801340 RepID=A0A937CIS4_9HYPH|nr:hypothetical protein [Rhizobium setariae]MBL0370400.1 hypothetical protein [Rhizobium setariae]
MKAFLRLLSLSLIASAYILAIPLAPHATYTTGFSNSSALADSRDPGHAKGDKGKQDSSSSGC